MSSAILAPVMKRNKRLRQFLLGSFLLLSCLLVALVLVRYRDSAAPEQVEPPPVSSADLSIDQFHYTETRDGETLWELQADSAEHDLTSGTTRISDVRVIFFDRGGLGELTLTANEGIWLADQRRLQINSDVVLRSPDGYTCYADQLVYTESDAHLRSSGPVRLLSSQAELRGVGLDIDLVNKKLRLLADVRSFWDLGEIIKERG